MFRTRSTSQLEFTKNDIKKTTATYREDDYIEKRLTRNNLTALKTQPHENDNMTGRRDYLSKISHTMSSFYNKEGRSIQA